MIIYPAIDLRGGKVVRLREGKKDRETIFSDNPAETAKQWVEQGASWIHTVNLDGAFAEANDNLRILQEVTKLNVNVQFGGGLRTMQDVKSALNAGAKRVVLGTAAIQNPDFVSEVLKEVDAESVCVALDARDGKITTHGWTEVSDETPVSFGKAMAKRGVIHALYTDVRRDGGMSGANLAETTRLAEETGLQVIASGGVSQLSEIQQLVDGKLVAGAIIGMALYTKEIALKDALTIAQGGA
ncbi:MAG: 1-(5-phosphoribosyl)-5-[(5-phosphoribosylamino)methylideneamino]imidazole-4-carboxamide isomerase [Aggregatilineales bacterium]